MSGPRESPTSSVGPGGGGGGNMRVVPYRTQGDRQTSHGCLKSLLSGSRAWNETYGLRHGLTWKTITILPTAAVHPGAAPTLLSSSLKVRAGPE